MKRNIILLLLLSLAFMMTSCEKPELRIVGVWELQNVIKNGTTYTKLEDIDHIGNKPTNYYNFGFGGNLVVNTYDSIDEVYAASVTGYWLLSNKNKDLEVSYTISHKNFRYVANIIKLSKKELKYEYTDNNNDKWELQFFYRSSY